MKTAARFLALSLVGLSTAACDRPAAPPPSAAEKHVLDSLSPPAVAVGNGQAALVKVDSGFALLIPRVRNRYEGSYEILFSASGNFKEDAVELQKKSGRFSDFKADVKGHRLTLYGESEESIWVQLSLGDTKILIAAVPSSDPKKLDLSKVRFEGNTEMDSEKWRKFLEEKGVLK